MRANYSTRRTSVVFNPRGGVFGGLGEETGGGANAPGEGGNVSSEGYGGETGGGANLPGTGGNIPGTGGGYAEAAADADAIAAQIALEASSKQAYAALAARAAAQAASAAATAKNIRSVLNATPIGRAISIFEAIGDIFSSIVNSRNDPEYAANVAAATAALREASALAAGPGGDSRLATQVTVLQNTLTSLEATKMANSQAAVTLLYQTYAKRNPDPASLAYWSNAFGPTITADEVFAFQEALYRNEPNLRPMAIATQTTAQTSTNLALPIIAAVAGFLIFGG
jgi:hypothetical protein